MRINDPRPRELTLALNVWLLAMEISPRGFIVQGSKLFLVNFGAAGFYPVCFDEIGLFCNGNWYKRIRRKLFSSRSANFHGMCQLRYLNLVGFTSV
jgi:hypothetical protein